MKRARRFRQIAQPVLEREPLLVRLCAAFVDHLGIILKTAMLFAAALFMQELQLLLADREGDDIGPAQPAVVQTDRTSPHRVKDEDSPILTDGVLHALNCTYTEYRETHFDECVDEPSQVYPRPIGDDPGGAWNPDQNRPLLLAHLDRSRPSR